MRHIFFILIFSERKKYYVKYLSYERMFSLFKNTFTAISNLSDSVFRMSEKR